MPYTQLTSAARNIRLPDFPSTLGAARKLVRLHLSSNASPARASLTHWLEAKSQQPDGEWVDNDLDLYGWCFAWRGQRMMLTRAFGRSGDPIHLTDAELTSAAEEFLCHSIQEQPCGVRLADSARTYDTLFSIKRQAAIEVTAPKRLHQAIAAKANELGYTSLK